MKHFNTILLTKLIIIPVILLRGWNQGYCLETTEEFLLSGSCLISQPGCLYIFVVNEDQFSSPKSGQLIQVFNGSASPDTPAYVRYSLRLPSGKYGVRCFLDINGNGELDRGLFGPTEPWGMSWSRQAVFGFPHFSDISFLVDHDREIPCIRLE